jgi:hypothetical protein
VQIILHWPEVFVSTVPAAAIKSTMDSENSQQAFARQLQRFRGLFQDELRQRGPLGSTLASPHAVLSFAEDLMLCPNEAAVIVRLQRDREAARGVYVIAGDAARAHDIAHVLAAFQFGPNETPFCLLASVVRAHAQAMIAKRGNSWGPPPFPKL